MESPIGTVVAFAGEFTKENVEMIEGMGWIPCDGRSLRHTINGVPTKFNDLFNVIRESFGEGFEANGTTKTGDFNVPDCRGRFLRGVSGNSGLDPDAGNRAAMRHGGNINNMVGSIQTDSFKSHSHTATSTVEPNPHSHSYREPAGGGSSEAPGNQGLENRTTGGTTLSVTTEIGNTGENETRPKNIYVNYIIKFVKDVGVLREQDERQRKERGGRQNY